LKQHNRGRKDSQFIDPEFTEALYEDKSSHSSSDRQAECGSPGRPACCGCDDYARARGSAPPFWGDLGNKPDASTGVVFCADLSSPGMDSNHIIDRFWYLAI